MNKFRFIQTFLLLSALSCVSCIKIFPEKGHGETLVEPSINFSVSAVNNNTNKKINYTKVIYASSFRSNDGTTQSVNLSIQTNNFQKYETLDCTPGDEISFNCHYQLDKKEKDWELSSITINIIGLDSNISIEDSDYSFKMTIPELTTGKYPVKFKLQYNATSDYFDGYCNGADEEILFNLCI